MMVMMIADADAAHVVVVPRLRRTLVLLVTDDLSAIFAQLTIHCRLAFAELGDTVAESTEHRFVIAQISCLDEFDIRKKLGCGLGLRVDAFDEHAGEQEIGEYDNAAKAELGRPGQCGIDPRMRDAAEGYFGPAQTNPFPQHPRQL